MATEDFFERLNESGQGPVYVKRMVREWHYFSNELAITGFSKRTIEAYTHCLEEYFSTIKYCGMLKTPSYAHIKMFLKYKADRGVASSTLNVYLCAIKFFYKRVAKSKRKIRVSFAKKVKRLPVVLSKNEILKCIEVTKNPKHKLIISLAYGAGLRVSEVTKLQLCDLDFERKLIHVRNAKGGRDRFTILPDKLLIEIADIVRWKCAGVNSRNRMTYLFESRRGGKLSVATLQKIFKKSLENSGVMKNASFHSLRHSFATHLLESGVSISYIQKFLGHKDLRTTLIYTKVTESALCGVKSPF
ncbi:MAG: tyrosine-type recombinase/integrase [Candidatus Peregrinibacteria bacterium]|nr:tyrosine-type recombinase/integrase [Candidatus Peregrinibacteria bacterium]